MSEPTIDPTNVSDRGNGKPAFDQVHWPHFPILERAEHDLPQLHMPGAYTVVRDRWERLVTSIDLPDSPQEVWRTLTDPSALKFWLAVCHGSLEQTQRDCMLDFEDGEFFLCRTIEARPPSYLQYLWRWLGIGQATSVTWAIEPTDQGTHITVTEEAVNPPWDWQTWNGGGWPGILDQLAAYLRTGTEWRWPWRRMGPYAQVELPVPFYEGWDRLFNPSGLRFWLQVMQGTMTLGESLTILMGDASGAVEMAVREIVLPGQSPPSFLPHVDFALKRPVWNSEVGGRLWMEPAGWGRSLLQVVHYNWENLPPGLQLSERKILASFWSGAARRASLMCGAAQARMGPHSWS
jgi:uncharacterized protein YndB with AHSA1/START domain